MDVFIPTNLVRILFDPAIPTSSFSLFNCFCTCFYSFFIAFCIIHQCHLTWVAHSTPVYFDSQVPKFVRAWKISSHAPMPRQADKEAAQVAMTLFLTAEGPPEELTLLEPSYS